MKPKNFKEANKTYTKPEGWTDEQCSSLPTFQHINQDGHSEIISCWQISDEELEKLKETKCIWFLMVSNVQTPILLSVDEYDMPFIQSSNFELSEESQKRLWLKSLYQNVTYDGYYQYGCDKCNNYFGYAKDCPIEEIQPMIDRHYNGECLRQ